MVGRGFHIQILVPANEPPAVMMEAPPETQRGLRQELQFSPEPSVLRGCFPLSLVPAAIAPGTSNRTDSRMVVKLFKRNCGSD